MTGSQWHHPAATEGGEQGCGLGDRAARRGGLASARGCSARSCAPTVDGGLLSATHLPPHPRGRVPRFCARRGRRRASVAARISRGHRDATGLAVVEGTYEIGMHDQAFLGLEAALALPAPGGRGVELHVATQWLYEDRKQIAACLGLEPEGVHLVLGGVGGAF